ncbi:MAG: hypothetical protein QM647_15160 [Asticcacaulis sp.]|uniref:hypothetical protein n=1 Tax=Asticcacaulis sp. TaxID=1872648 RepID=UPI0039E23470
MAEEEKKKLTQKQAAYLHFNKPKEKPMADAVKAEAPRQPTREENRRINDALEEHYEVAKQCYRLNFSDESLAGKLNVPRAWVSDIRDRFFGPNVSASKLEAPAKLREYEAKLKELSDKALGLAQEVEDTLKSLQQYRVGLDYQGVA